MLDFYDKEVNVGDKVLTYYMGLPNDYTMTEGMIEKIGSGTTNDYEYDNREWATIIVEKKLLNDIVHVRIFRTGKEIVKI